MRNYNMEKTERTASSKQRKNGAGHFDSLKESISVQLAHCKNDGYNNTASAKHDRNELLKLKNRIEKTFAEAEAVYREPLEASRFELLKLTVPIDAKLAEADRYIEAHTESEEKERRAKLRELFEQSRALLGSYADSVFESPAFLEPKWLKKGYLSPTVSEEMAEKSARIAANLSSIETTSGTAAPFLIAEYLKTLSMSDVAEYQSAVLKAANCRMPGIVRLCDDGDKLGTAEITLNCDEANFRRTLEQLRLMNIDYRVNSTSYAPQPHELKIPDFDSFVAVDIETTGSFGAAVGDKPAQITEIGAVKVENGRITDRFSMLANPGRKITPHVVKLTHITDEMVKDKPPASEVIKKFFDFAEGFILVGHGFKCSDLPFIRNCAQNAGIDFSNSYFDTCEFAETLKEKYGWQKLRLEYLSELFGVEQNEAHRALCDAEANVGVYFALKALR